jgi:hypothetical protein
VYNLCCVGFLSERKNQLCQLVAAVIDNQQLPALGRIALFQKATDCDPGPFLVS